jgi:hypothetical protein
MRVEEGRGACLEQADKVSRNDWMLVHATAADMPHNASSASQTQTQTQTQLIREHQGDDKHGSSTVVPGCTHAQMRRGKHQRSGRRH